MTDRVLPTIDELDLSNSKHPEIAKLGAGQLLEVFAREPEAHRAALLQRQMENPGPIIMVVRSSVLIGSELTPKEISFIDWDGTARGIVRAVHGALKKVYKLNSNK